MPRVLSAPVRLQVALLLSTAPSMAANTTISRSPTQESSERQDEVPRVYSSGPGLVVETIEEPERSAVVEEKPLLEAMSATELAMSTSEKSNSKALLGRLTAPLVYLALTACQGVWIAYYIIAYVHPNPRRIINSTTRRWGAYTAFMFIFGSVHTFVNLFLWGALAIASLQCRIFDTGSHRRAKSAVAALFIPPIALFMIIMPILGTQILIPPIQRQVYNHMCDSYGAHVVLEGRGSKQPMYVANSARFYARNSQQPLFTLDLEQTNVSSATFRLREFNVEATSLPPELVPALQSVSYDFDNRQLSGACNNMTGSCLDGSFDMDRLTLDMSYNITGTSVHSRTQAEHNQWVWKKSKPSLILRALTDNGALGDKILQTAVTKVNDCTSLKVCISGGGGGLVGPDVVAPLGIIFTKHAAYSHFCSNRIG